MPLALDAFRKAIRNEMGSDMALLQIDNTTALDLVEHALDEIQQFTSDGCILAHGVRCARARVCVCAAYPTYSCENVRL